MKLRDLEAFFTKYHERAVPPDQYFEGVMHTSGVQRSFHRVDTLEEADGVWFICPKCFAADRHRVKVGFHGKATPGTYGHNSKGEPVLWTVAGGTSLDDLQLTPSIQIEGCCNWHGFVGSNGVPPGEAA